jgi:hypothetical protein
MRTRLRTYAGRATSLAQVVTFGVMLLGAACSGATAGSSTDTVTSSQPTQRRTDPSPSPTIAAFTGLDGHQVRRCSEAIAVIPDRSRAVPSARFLEIDSAAQIGMDELSPDDEGRLTIHKFVLQVPRGAGLIAVSVAPRDRDVIGLSYDAQQLAAGALPIRDAAHTVVVEMCADGDAQYNGGFVVDGARCVHIRVEDLTSNAVEPRSIPFGTTPCS